MKRFVHYLEGFAVPVEEGFYSVTIGGFMAKKDNREVEEIVKETISEHKEEVYAETFKPVYDREVKEIEERFGVTIKEYGEHAKGTLAVFLQKGIIPKEKSVKIVSSEWRFSTGEKGSFELYLCPNSRILIAKYRKFTEVYGAINKVPEELLKCHLDSYSTQYPSGGWSHRENLVCRGQP